MAEIKTFTEPKSLYRYRSLQTPDRFEREMDAIRTARLWCSDFESLNDPMEGVYDVTKELRNAAYYQRVRDRIYDAKAALGICSFSETNDNGVMWAHYAGQCNGICIEYSVQGLLEGLDPDIDLVRVSYNDKTHLVSTKAVDDTNLAKKILSNKNQNWLYEREWRLLSPHPGTIRIRSDEAITRVYLGNRLSERDRSAARKILDRSDIPYREMEVDGYEIYFPKPRKARAA